MLGWQDLETYVPLELVRLAGGCPTHSANTDVYYPNFSHNIGIAIPCLTPKRRKPSSDGCILTRKFPLPYKYPAGASSRRCCMTRIAWAEERSTVAHRGMALRYIFDEGLMTSMAGIQRQPALRLVRFSMKPLKNCAFHDNLP